MAKGERARVWIVEALTRPADVWRPVVEFPYRTRSRALARARILRLNYPGLPARVACYERVEPKRRKHR